MKTDYTERRLLEKQKESEQQTRRRLEELKADLQRHMKAPKLEVPREVQAFRDKIKTMYVDLSEGLNEIMRAKQEFRDVLELGIRQRQGTM